MDKKTLKKANEINNNIESLIKSKNALEKIEIEIKCWNTTGGFSPGIYDNDWNLLKDAGIDKEKDQKDLSLLYIKKIETYINSLESELEQL